MKPNILALDIETSPITSYHWGLFDQNIALNQIVQDWVVLSWAAKWLDKPGAKIMQQDQRNSCRIYEDKKLLKDLWKLLDEADIVLTQNGKSFDIKKLNARFIMNDMPPPSSFRQIDTLQLARKHFGFTSNKLEYMTSKLCTKYKKSQHKKFPGFELWTQCLLGNKEAWKEMRKYNIGDVLSLEELYKKLAPWDNSINRAVYQPTPSSPCSCGKPSWSKKGFSYTNMGQYQRYRCMNCGAQQTSKENLLSKQKRESLRK